MAQKMFSRPSKAAVAKEEPDTSSMWPAGAEAAAATAAEPILIPDDPVAAAEQTAKMALLAQKVGDPRIQVSHLSVYRVLS